MTDCDEWWRKAFQKESRKSEFDVNVSENPSDFGLQKNCRIATTFEFELRHIPRRSPSVPMVFKCKGVFWSLTLAESDEFPLPSMGNFIITLMWAVIITVEIWMKNLNNWCRFFLQCWLPFLLLKHWREPTALTPDGKNHPLVSGFCDPPTDF